MDILVGLSCRVDGFRYWCFIDEFVLTYCSRCHGTENFWVTSAELVVAMLSVIE